MKTIILRLKAPLQSYGTHSRSRFRDTNEFPTKSAIIGLLACSMGLPENSDLTALVKLCYKVRIDYSGRIISDFHTAYCPVDGIVTKNFESSSRSKTAILSNKYYIEDGEFMVFISGDDVIINECWDALKNPKWQTFLGRKCCVPDCPFLMRLVSDPIDSAILNFPIFDDCFDKNRDFIRVISDGEWKDGMCYYDNPKSFERLNRQYNLRYIHSDYIPAEKFKYEKRDRMLSYVSI